MPRFKNLIKEKILFKKQFKYLLNYYSKSVVKNNELFLMTGQSTLEIIIALAILTISISAVIIISFGNQSFSIDTEVNNQALYKAKEILENARATARQNFNSLTSASTTDGMFLKETLVGNLGTYEKKITSIISWQTSPLKNQKVELSTIVSDYKSVINFGGDTGGSGLSGDWRNPRTLGSIDLGPGNSATGLDVLNKIVYLSSAASDSKKPDFYIVDATNGQSPVIVSSLNTGTGLNAVDVAGHYAYVGNNEDDEQLQIIDVSNINNPLLVKSYELLGVSGAGAVGNSIFYYGSKIYIGTKKATGPEFHVVDVSSATNPVELGSFEVNANVNDIYVRNDIAYIATSDNQELILLDVFNPSNISKISGYDAPGDSEDGKSLYLVVNNLYLGRLIGGNHEEHHEFHILNVGSSTAIQNLGSKDMAADVNSVVVCDYLAFLATSDSNKEFQVWNISNPANIAFWSSFNFSQVATGIDYEDNIIYVSVRSNDALRIITSSP